MRTIVCAALVAATLAPAAPVFAGGDPIARGRYIVATSSCNDCHTPGYMQSGGKVPETQWLTGDGVGWHGPWGTTYPANLRRIAAKMTEAEWIKRARTPLRPPMPSPSLMAMTDADLVALYRYIRSLPVAGPDAPAYVPPGGKIATPYLDLTPKNLPPQASK